MSPWLTLFVSVSLAALVALLLGLLTLRLSGHYLPLGTLAWGISLYYLFGNMQWLGGHTGITKIPHITFFGLALDTSRAFFYLNWGVLLFAMLATANVLDSREGRAIRALKNGELPASLGVDPVRTKMTAFIYAAMLAAISGWLYAHMQRFVNPTPFSLEYGIEYLFMAVLGGALNVGGALLGSAIVTLLRESLSDTLPRLIGHNGNFEIIIYGAIVILVMQLAPKGLWPLVERLLPRRQTRAVAALAHVLPGRQKPERGSVIARIKGATKKYGGLVAVDNVSFDIHAGEIVALIGPNGAGKTTLFSLISGLNPMSAGRIEILGRSVGDVAAHDVARLGVARTFQHVNLLQPDSALENVAMGAYLRTRSGVLKSALRLDRREEAAVQVTAREQLRRLGLGDREQIAAGSLALGEQRLLEIARALASDPCLLLLDEPAAGLRHLEKRKLAEVLSGLRAEGMGILIVEHDMEFVMGLVDRIVVLDFGVKIAEGAPEEVRRNPEVEQAYLGADA
jgi:branched-chain amino acid transport system permease protein